jgi:hypothetical protein
MIRKSLRTMLLVGLVFSAVTASGTVVTVANVSGHHQPVPCEPDC